MSTAKGDSPIRAERVGQRISPPGPPHPGRATVGRRLSLSGTSPEEAARISRQADALLATFLQSGKMVYEGTRLAFDCEGFSSEQQQAVSALLRSIGDGLGAAFPPAHRITVQNDPQLPHMGMSFFYGDEAEIRFNFDAHLGKDGVVDSTALGAMAQTLAHEIILHTLKEFLTYETQGKRIPGLDGHRDACQPQTRDAHFELAWLACRRLPPDQQFSYAREWQIDVEALSKKQELGFSKTEMAAFERWAQAQAHVMRARIQDLQRAWQSAARADPVP